MAQSTSIQWTNSSVNPVMGCGGCPLFPTIIQLREALLDAVFMFVHPSDRSRVEALCDRFLNGLEPSDAYTRRQELIDALSLHLGRVPKLGATIGRVFRKRVKCYAAKLHHVRRKNKGYARTFEHPEKFAGRMAEAAKWSDLRGKTVEGKEWLAGQPRLIFVSDMGDALSNEIDFEYLKTEIIDIVTTSLGKRHVWLWLTKRPARMATFAAWLKVQGIAWPTNLVAMTSVIDTRMAKQVKHLRKVPATLRGLSVEPLSEPVKLDLEGISWVIVGGESGSEEAEPFDLAWVRNLREQCRAAGVAFFVKQLGRNPVENGQRLVLEDKHGGDWEEWPDDLRIREVPDFTQLV